MFSNRNIFSDSVMGEVQKIISGGVGPTLSPELIDQAKKTAKNLSEVYDVDNQRDVLKTDFDAVITKNGIDSDVSLMNSFADAVKKFMIENKNIESQKD